MDAVVKPSALAFFAGEIFLAINIPLAIHNAAIVDKGWYWFAAAYVFGLWGFWKFWRAMQ